MPFNLSQSENFSDLTKIINLNQSLKQTPPLLLSTNNIYIINSSTTVQAENSVFISPLDKNTLLNSNNSTNWPATVSYGADDFISTNGGTSWSGSIQGVGGTNQGDPSTIIGRYDPNSDGKGRMYVGFINNNNAQGLAYSDDNGLNWSTSTIATRPSSIFLLDKGHLWIDNKLYKADGTSNPYQGHLYAAWYEVDFSPPTGNNGQIMFSYSTDNGITWQTPVNISSGANALDHNTGVNIKTGPNGEVYACWAVYDNFTISNHSEIAIGFNQWDGNSSHSWGTASRIISNIKGIMTAPATVSNDPSVCGNTTDFHIIPELGGGKYMRTNSFPSMTVNKQNGNLYIVWTNRGVPGTNTGDPDIYMIKSTNGGSSWNTPLKINQDTQNNGKDQWFPWIACDEASGVLACLYYDSRDFTNNDRVNEYVSISYDDGSTWADNKINDASTDWDGNGIAGKCSPPSSLFAAGYAGDYLGIDAFHGLIIPVWSDKRNSNMLAFTNPFNATCPTNLNLTSGNYNITGEGGNFTYDAAYSVSNDIIAAGSGSTYKVYSGAKVYTSAGNSITLNDGFEASGEFTADITTCSNFSQRINNNNNSSSESSDVDNSLFTSSNFPVSIFPNPSKDGRINTYIPIATVQEQGMQNESATIFIYNSMGEEVYQSKVNEGISEISFTSQPPGLYMFKVVKGDKVYNGKIVLQ